MLNDWGERDKRSSDAFVGRIAEDAQQAESVRDALTCVGGLLLIAVQGSAIVIAVLN
jgi:hypothetical protein